MSSVFFRESSASIGVTGASVISEPVLVVRRSSRPKFEFTLSATSVRVSPFARSPSDLQLSPIANVSIVQTSSNLRALIPSASRCLIVLLNGTTNELVGPIMLLGALRFERVEPPPTV